MKDLKKWLIPVSMMTMTCGFAAEEIADNCCPTPCCPPPCPPKPCINCECYNPQFYDLQCDWGMFVSVDFLYWYARESNLEFANTIQYTVQPNQGLVTQQTPIFIQDGYIVDHHYLKSKWKPGFRVGIGMNSDCDGWDVYLNYTYIDNNTSGSRSAPLLDANDPNLDLSVNGLVNGVSNPWASSIATLRLNLDQLSPAFTQVYAPRVSAKWSLIFNQLDFEIGKKYWVSKCFTLRPYTGLRGAWTHTNFRVTSIANGVQSFGANPTRTANIFNSNKFRNRFWGVGILGGVQPQFVFGDWCGCGVFSLYGNVEGALIWGEYSGKNRLRYNQTLTINSVPPVVMTQFSNPVEKDHFSRMQGILDVGIGLRWEEQWCCYRYMTTIDLGWEHHYWFDYGLYHRTSSGTDISPFNAIFMYSPRESLNYATNLGLGGFVLRFRLDF